MKTVAVFRSHYLPLSETFISDHLRSLRSFRPIVLCERESAAAHRPPIEPKTLPGGRLGNVLFRRWGLAPTFKAALRKEGAELIHIHFLIDAAIALPFLERTDLPLVVTAHGYDATLTDEALSASVDGRLLVERRQRLIRRVDRIVCVSEFIRDELMRRGYPAEKMVTLPLGVDVEALQPRSPDFCGRGILAVGRLVEKKGMHKLIEAYSMLPLRLRELHPLTIIGDGPLRGSLQQQAKELGVSVEFAGGLPREDVLKAMRAAAVFCLPSIRAKNGDAEGMPISIMEALALGVPVAIFDDQPMAGMLKEHHAGLTAQAGSASALAASLNGLASDLDEAARISAAGRQFCAETFSLYTNTLQLEALYARLTRDGSDVPR